MTGQRVLRYNDRRVEIQITVFHVTTEAKDLVNNLLMCSQGSSHKSGVHTRWRMNKTDCIDKSTCTIQETAVQHRLI